MPTGIDGRTVETVECKICSAKYTRYKGISVKTCSPVCRNKLKTLSLSKKQTIKPRCSKKNESEEMIRTKDLKDRRSHLTTLISDCDNEGEIL